ncbi:MAG: AAA family ATPase [Spirochaetes bacterium]|nr:MAG: AAA family ATPase [Spirochaetota bacterium]
MVFLHISSYYLMDFYIIPCYYIYMKRDIENYLSSWKKRESHKPLIIRGARQVGKTWSVNALAETFPYYIKIDFEENRDAISYFRDNNVERIINEISLSTGIPIIDNETLLFFDECQLCPDVLKSLRYFFEKRSGLHVIAAGSLLDFTLNELKYPMPVGRVEFMYMYPLSFCEFLSALNKQNLRQFIESYILNKDIPPIIHNQLLEALRNYYFIGGMPEVVKEYINSHDFLSVQRIQTELTTSIQNDFSKYTNKNELHYLSEVFLYLARNTGKKIKYSNINNQVRSNIVKKAIESLVLARISHRVYHSQGDGIPLGAEIKPEHFKTSFVDIGLSNRICGLELTNTLDMLTIREGLLAEQFAAQELVASFLPFEDRELYYWIRQNKNANAEVDYLTTVNNRVIPIEIKAGTTGSLKSLHVFMVSKIKSPFAVRLNLSSPSVTETNHKIRVEGEDKIVDFKLVSLPLYLISQVRRITSEIEIL